MRAAQALPQLTAVLVPGMTWSWWPGRHMCCSVTAWEAPNQSTVPRGMCCLECSGCAGIAQSKHGLSPAKAEPQSLPEKRSPLSLLAIWIPVLMSSNSALRVVAELYFIQQCCLRTVPSLCPRSPWPARALEIPALTYCSSFPVLCLQTQGLWL